MWIPALHLDLEIFPWLMSAFQAEILVLDINIGGFATSEAVDGDAIIFSELLNLHADVKNTEEDLTGVASQRYSVQQQLHYFVFFADQLNVTNPAIESAAQQMQQQCLDLDIQYSDLQTRKTALEENMETTKKSKSLQGPCTASIEPILQCHGIERQAYHGGALVGNHVHKALKPTVVHATVSAPVAVVATRCPALLHEAESIRGK